MYQWLKPKYIYICFVYIAFSDNSNANDTNSFNDVMTWIINMHIITQSSPKQDVTSEKTAIKTVYSSYVGFAVFALSCFCSKLKSRKKKKTVEKLMKWFVCNRDGYGSLLWKWFKQTFKMKNPFKESISKTNKKKCSHWLWTIHF